MARAHLAELSLEVPAGWEDQSTLTLLGPAPRPSGLLRVQAEPPRPSLVLRRQVLPGPRINLETFAEAQEELMGRLAPGARVLGRTELTVGRESWPGRAVDYLIPGSPLGEMRQLQVYFYADEVFFVLVGTAPAGLAYEEARREFLAAAATLTRG